VTRPNPSTALAESVIDELYRNGVRLVAISPGSRSGALAIAAAAHPGLHSVVALDERSAAFHALGNAKATGRPSAVIATSGTAPANWFPAVVEADMSMTPVILISADRPAELRGVGANQTIDQVGMFGDKVRHAGELSADTGGNDQWRGEVSSAIAVATGVRPGPAHLNIAFREPTVPVTDDGRTAAEPFDDPVEGRPGGRPWLEALEEPRPSPPTIPFAPRGLVIAGDGAYDRALLVTEAQRLGWPVLGTALAGIRGWSAVTSYHHILAGPAPEELRPETVLAVGHIGPSDRLDRLVSLATTRVRVDVWGRHIDPARDATHRSACDPVDMLRHIDGGGADNEWSGAWARADEAVREAVDTVIDTQPRPTGPGIARVLTSLDWDLLVVGSSLPIRDVDAHVTRGGAIVGNRGASGIDGLVSTALGAATTADRALAFLGDLSLLHDANGFLIDRPRDLTLVVANNGGGGLFDTLPQANHAPEYERLFLTPQHRSFAELALLHRLGHATVSDIGDLSQTVTTAVETGGIQIVEVVVDRNDDMAMRRALDDVGRSAVASLHP
jgi:2-succinyl-5-enolpyruvyl-6-hydroxy-3-cyclohexene-1-carboxylate synthase